MARQGLAIAGGAIGAYFGGAVGAQLGFALGSAIGGMIDPEIIQGPKLGEVPTQTGRDGVPIPVGWGVCHTAGNIIWKNEVVEVEEEQEGGGKGGGPKVMVTKRYRTFGISAMRSITGPIAGFVRIWENDKLVYDRRASPAIPTAESDAYEEHLTFYLGGEDQLPDPAREAEVGVGNTPGYKGLPYVVWNDYDVTDFLGAVQQFRFEIVTFLDQIITSKPYPIDALEGVTQIAEEIDPFKSYQWEEGIDSTITVLPGVLGTPLKQYDLWPPEGLDSTIDPQDGTLEVKLKIYDLWPPEGLASTIDPQNGTLEVKLVQYTNWPPEGLAATITPQDGTLV